MAEVHPFRGLHYDWNAVSPADVIAPPYDVIDASGRGRLLARSPCNTVRLIFPGDPDDSVRYERARATLREWIERGVLVRDKSPAFYVYRQTFEIAAKRLTRTGFFAAVDLEEFEAGTIHAHEKTLDAPKEDRYRLLAATRTNLSPVFGLLDDEDAEVAALIGEAPAGGGVSFEEGGVLHDLAPVADAGFQERLIDACASRAIFIADGHHRYESALRYLRETASGSTSKEDPRSAVMMFCVSTRDPGLVVLPTHRIFELASAMSIQDLMSLLDGVMEFGGIVEGPDAPRALEDLLERESRPHSFAFLCHEAGKGVPATWTAPPNERSSIAGVSLDVLILHRLIVPLLAADAAPSVTYSHDVDEVGRDLARSERRLGVLMAPTPLDSMIRVARRRERLPAKTTFFYPKVPTALVMRPLCNEEQGGAGE